MDVLDEVYRAYVESGPNAIVKVSEIRDRLDLDQLSMAKALHWLIGHRYVVFSSPEDGLIITALGIDEIERARNKTVDSPKSHKQSTDMGERTIPIEIQDSLGLFKKDHPDAARVGFIMMKFKDTPAHDKILKSVKNTLRKHGLEGIRSDEREYHKDLFYNVETYMQGCGFGIAVYDRIEEEGFSPNVSLETGYMMALRKHVCLLKDKNLQTLHADLLGKLYKPFDPQNPEKTIPDELSKWLHDKEIVE